MFVVVGYGSSLCCYRNKPNEYKGWNPVDHGNSPLQKIFHEVHFKGAMNMQMSDWMLCLTSFYDDIPGFVDGKKVLESVKNLKLIKGMPENHIIKKNYIKQCIADRKAKGLATGDKKQMIHDIMDEHETNPYFELYKVEKNVFMMRVCCLSVGRV